jgi:hypothetical protein
MAAKGAILKQQIAEKILKTFSGSFMYNDGKEIRINGMEDGNPVQIKITMTAAKVAVEPEGSNPKLTGTESDLENTGIDFTAGAVSSVQVPNEPSEDEKARLTMLLDKLGI